MGRAATSRIIAELEETSRRRELTEQESWRLQKMITTQRRYDRRREAAHGQQA